MTRKELSNYQQIKMTSLIIVTCNSRFYQSRTSHNKIHQKNSKGKSRGDGLNIKKIRIRKIYVKMDHQLKNQVMQVMVETTKIDKMKLLLS